MKIEVNIAKLLYRYQCVTVPGFGAFLTEMQSAQIQESSHAFYPPKKLISFNPLIKNNDGLLANHIAVTEQVSYEEATEMIRQEVEIWNNILQVNGQFTLKNIGELILTAEHKIVFNPADTLNFATGSFGLSSFVSPAIKRAATQELVDAISEPAVVALLEETPKAKRRVVWPYAAIAILALGISSVISYKAYEQDIQQQTLAVEKQVQQQVQSRIQEATFVMENPLPAVTLPVTEEKLNYHIVAGVFRSEENAEKATKNLREKGFNARRIPVNKHGLYPVLYGSFATAKEAKAQMEEIRLKNDPQAWLLVKEL